MNLQRTKAIFRKEFIEIIRDRRSLIIVFLLPLVLILLYGYSVTFDIKNIDIGLIDRDNSSLSREYITQIISSGYFILHEDGYNNFKKNIDAVKRDKIKFIIVIPPDFSWNIKKGKETSVQVLTDGSIANTALIGLGYMRMINMNFSSNIKFDYLKTKGLVRKEFPFISMAGRIWYNQELRSINFIVPGLISMIMMLVAALLTSLTIVREKEYGTYEEIISTPITAFEFLMGKMLPYVIIGLADVLLVIFFGKFWFSVPFRGSVMILLFFSLLFIFCSLGIGILISSIAKKQETAIMMAAFTTLLPSILLSGFIFPIESMPRAIQYISYIIPIRYYLVALRSIFLKQDVTIFILYKEALFLIAVSFVFLVMSARIIKSRKF